MEPDNHKSQKHILPKLAVEAKNEQWLFFVLTEKRVLKMTDYPLFF